MLAIELLLVRRTGTPSIRQLESFPAKHLEKIDLYVSLIKGVIEELISLLILSNSQ